MAFMMRMMPGRNHGGDSGEPEILGTGFALDRPTTARYDEPLEFCQRLAAA